MVNAIFYSNLAQPTTLNGSITAGATSMTVVAVTGFPGSYPYVLAVDHGAATEELVLVTNAADKTLTVVRGYGGTGAQSHSTGADVVHVYSAQDATDFRTHEAATQSVHGVTGDLVGTSTTQTLSNKTLTSPTINSGGALNGTFTGSPTLAGAVTLSGGATLSGTVTGSSATLAGTFAGTPTLSGAALFTGTPVIEGSSATAEALRVRASGEAVPRLSVRADGRLSWSDGIGPADVVLYRDTANSLGTDHIIRVWRTTAGSDALSLRVIGDSSSRFVVDADGTMAWGPGGAAAQDVGLARAGAGALTTDAAFTARKETTTTGLAAASGWNVVSFDAQRTCGVCSVRMSVERTGADVGPGDSVGNITDTLMATVPSGWRPSFAQRTTFDRAGVSFGLAVIETTGQVELKAIVPGSTIFTSHAIHLSATYLL